MFELAGLVSGKTIGRLALTVAAFAGVIAAAQTQTDALKDGFANPPQSARPRVWWHWMNGNISEEGITLDLEWMHRVGIAGFHNFDAAMATPQVVPRRISYMTPEWKSAFVYATKLADQLGMEEGIAGSPGWSETGGPWVTPAHGMKKYVWSELEVEGGRSFTGKLPHPPQTTGAFQNIGIIDPLAQKPAGGTPQFYADAAVVAYRLPDRFAADKEQPKITASGAGLDAAMLSDGDLATMTGVPMAPAGGASWIQFEYVSPKTMRSVTYVAKDPVGFEAMLTGSTAPERTLEASDDGVHFRPVVSMNGGSAPEHTLSFAPVTARMFRVSFKPGRKLPLPPWMADTNLEDAGIHLPPAPTRYELAELVLHAEPRVNHFEEKAAFATEPDLYGFATAPVDRKDAIAKSDVVDLTGRMRPDGSLDWTPPPGHWVVLRIGYSLMGITNHPATPEATGLEVDKLDHRFVRDYFEKYLDSYKDTVSASMMGKRGISAVVNDSWEAGSQNWTDNMLADFKRLRGYDATPWLPVLAGRVVESAEASDRFLWDFRKTIADLIAGEHYGELETVLHERGMMHYGESHESGRALVADGMEVKKFNEVPMSAMWTTVPGFNPEQFGYNADDRESASVSHIYGQNLAAAESMTAAAAPWAWSPATLKPTADQELLNGINRFVIHESAHQPLVDKKPGMTLGPFGQWFNRNETWAEQAGPWIDYLARSSFLLQQGHFAADIIYFYGEDSNLTALFADKSPQIPAGYGFDYVNADALIHELSVADGRIVTRSGMQYKLLGLDAYSRHMSLPVLRAIAELVKAGAVVAGTKPDDDPSLADNAAEFTKISDELFGDGTGTRTVGKGRVYAGQTVAQALIAMKAPKDFDYSQRGADTRIEFVHRKLEDGDIYFVDNRSDKPAVVDATFRVAGKQPELWHAETAKTEAPSFSAADGRTSVPLSLEPWGTVFVVFRKPTAETHHVIAPVTETLLATLSGPWKLAFQPGRGAPESIEMESLSDWSKNADPGVRYFSGIGTYSKVVDVPAAWLSSSEKLWLDLGDVKNLAVVTINGNRVGEAWHTPYKVDITQALHAGKNEVRIEVINAWVNRLIGDQQPGAAKFTFADIHPYKATSPLLASGLLGPVTVSSSNAAR